MKFAVSLYSDTANPNAYPGDVIYQQLLVDDSAVDLPAGYSSFMDQATIDQYISDHAISYESFSGMIASEKSQALLVQSGRQKISAQIDVSRAIAIDIGYYCSGLSTADMMTLLNLIAPVLRSMIIGQNLIGANILGVLAPNETLDANYDPTVLNDYSSTGVTFRQYLINRLSSGS